MLSSPTLPMLRHTKMVKNNKVSPICYTCTFIMKGHFITSAGTLILTL